MKRPGDGWTKINWYICPFCGKKGYYWKYNGTGKDWFCKYCKTSGHKPNGKMKVNKQIVVFCDEGQDDWNNYFAQDFKNAGIVFTNLRIFNNPTAFDQSFDVFMFDWGGMSLGNSLLDHFIRRIYHMAENSPNKDFVLLSRFTERAYEDMIEQSTERLFNILSVDEYIKKLKNGINK